MKLDEIFCDMDGVLVDFASRACAACGFPGHEVTHWKFYEDWDMPVSEFWEHIGRDSRFWWELEPYPWATQLIRNLRKIAPLRILTHPYKDSRSWAGKYDTLISLGVRHEEIIMSGVEKEFAVSRHSLLIDDKDSHVEDWSEAGGIGVLFPRAWNQAKLQADDPLSYLEKKLDKCLGKASNLSRRL